MKTKNVYYPELKSPILRLNKIYASQIHHFELDTKTEWINEILRPHSLASEEHPSTFKVQFNLRRLEKEDLGDPVAIEGELHAVFWTECIRCLTPVQQVIEADINSAFIPADKESDPEIEDQETLYADESELDIYLFNGQDINIKELFDEIIQIHIDPFPLHAEDCQGLCQFCGVDLNHEKCHCPAK